MKTIRALAIVGIIGMSGCTGFAAGLKHALVGAEPTAEQKAAPGYDLTVMAVNALLTLGGYALRHYQEKVLPKKAEPGT